MNYFSILIIILSSLPVPYPSITCTLPAHFLSITNPLTVPYPSGLPRSHKGTGTDTIFDFRPPPPPTTTKLFRSLYSPLGILYPSHTCPLPLSYPLAPSPPLPCKSITYPLSVPFLSLTHPLPFPYF